MKRLISRQFVRLVSERRAVTRGGATLSEVLIAVLIMGIGLASVASLFPISMLRSIQAHQLTVGTIHRMNVEYMLDLYPHLLNDPDNDGNTAEHNNTRFIVDPLGYSTAPGGGKDFLGNQTPGTGTNRFFAGFTATSIPSAAAVATNLDTWLTRYEDIATASTTTSGAIPNIHNQNITNTNDIRATIFNATGTASETRAITFPILGNILRGEDTNGNNALDPGEDINGNSVLDNDLIQWTEDINGNTTLDTGEDVNNNGALDTNALPAGFVVGNIRIENRQPQFSWLLSVRKDAVGIPDVSVVVFFRRTFATNDAFMGNDEHPYNATFNAGSRTVTVTWNTATEDPPFLKRGSFVFDGKSTNCRWYRIQSFVEGTGTATLTLDTPARENANTQTAVFMRGIVDVWPIGHH